MPSARTSHQFVLRSKPLKQGVLTGLHNTKGFGLAGRKTGQNFTQDVESHVVVTPKRCFFRKGRFKGSIKVVFFLFSTDGFLFWITVWMLSRSDKLQHAEKHIFQRKFKVRMESISDAFSSKYLKPCSSFN